MLLSITFGECAETEDVHLLDLDFFRFLRRLVDSNLEACQRKLRRTEPSPTKSAPSTGSTNGARLFLLHFMSKVTQDCRCFPQGIVCSGCFPSQLDASAELLFRRSVPHPSSPHKAGGDLSLLSFLMLNAVSASGGLAQSFCFTSMSHALIGAGRQAEGLMQAAS